MNKQLHTRTESQGLKKRETLIDSNREIIKRIDVQHSKKQFQEQFAQSLSKTPDRKQLVYIMKKNISKLAPDNSKKHIQQIDSFLRSSIVKKELSMTKKPYISSKVTEVLEEIEGMRNPLKTFNLLDDQKINKKRNLNNTIEIKQWLTMTTQPNELMHQTQTNQDFLNKLFSPSKVSRTKRSAYDSLNSTLNPGSNIFNPMKTIQPSTGMKSQNKLMSDSLTMVNVMLNKDQLQKLTQSKFMSVAQTIKPRPHSNYGLKTSQDSSNFSNPYQQRTKTDLKQRDYKLSKILTRLQQQNSSQSDLFKVFGSESFLNQRLQSSQSASRNHIVKDNSFFTNTYF